MVTYKMPKQPTQYYCEICNFNSSKKSNYDIHLTTAKHTKILNGDNNQSVKCPTCESVNCHKCQCGKCFKHRQGLSRHRNNCNYNSSQESKMKEVTDNDDKLSNTIIMLVKQNQELVKENQEFKQLMIDQNQTDLIFDLVKENQEFKQLLIDQNKQMMKMAGNMGNNTVNNTNNVNSHNKFNLNVFLNEDCKNAMSLTDFVNSMNLTIEDFIQTGELGFVDGISKVMVERINNMELHDRPVHCTDLKRETVYVKDQDKWEKDEEKVRLRKAVNNVAKDNKSLTSEWMEATPDVNTSGTANYENFFKYSQSALGGMGTDKNKAFEDKIMKNIMKETTIDRGQSTE